MPGSPMKSHSRSASSHAATSVTSPPSPSKAFLRKMITGVEATSRRPPPFFSAVSPTESSDNILATPRSSRKAGVVGTPNVGWQGKVKAETQALEDRQNGFSSVPYSAVQSKSSNGDKMLPRAPQPVNPSSPGKENYAPSTNKTTVPASAFQSPPKPAPFEWSSRLPEQTFERKPSYDRYPPPEIMASVTSSPKPKPPTRSPKKEPSFYNDTPYVESSLCDQTFPSFASCGGGSSGSPAPTPPTKYADLPIHQHQQQQQSTPLREQILKGHQRAYSTPHSAYSSDHEQSHSRYNITNNESPARNIMRHQNSSDAISMQRPSSHVSPRVQHSEQDLRREYHQEYPARSQSQFINEDTDDRNYNNNDVFASDSMHKESAEKQFSDLMDSMQIPEAIRQKMLALDPSVKQGMLTSPPSALSAFIPAQLPTSSASSTTKRKGKHTSRAKSSSSLFFVLPKRNQAMSETNIVADINSKKGIEKLGKKDKDMQSPANLTVLLRSKRLNTITEDEVKKVRTVLRSAGVAWLQEWDRLGGYEGLLDRLGEVLAVEWREEQHDDKVLHELLRCVKALLLSEIGRKMLASYCPTPFRSLSQLLYSEKKPGDLTCRQVIIDILLGLFEIFPHETPMLDQSEWKKPLDSSVYSNASGDESPVLWQHSDNREVMMESTTPGYVNIPNYRRNDNFDSPMSSNNSSSNSVTMSTFELVRNLVLGPPDEKEEAHVDFMKDMRKPRLFRRWVSELEGVCMDYFWIFCHSNNRIWRLEEINEEEIEAPKVPGGMTGGVENEAMQYCRVHLRLINRLANSAPSKEAARQLHSDLFASGFERVLFTLRKASTEYYPALHLELARYVGGAIKIGCEMPLSVLRCIAEPKWTRGVLDAARRRQ